MMIRFLSLITAGLIATNTNAYGQFSEEVSKISRRGMPYREVVVTVKSPIERCFFSCSTEEVTIRGLLWLPEKEKPPYKLIVFSHGAQGPTPSYPKGVEPDTTGLPGEYFSNGYAVMMAYRKGRSVNDLPRPDISADYAETNNCDSDVRPGFKSAVSDVKAYLVALRSRTDLNSSKIILMGHSRGGFVSLGVASEGLAGIVGVITISAGWMSEFAMWGPDAGVGRCNQGSNELLLKELGEKVRVPLLALYGGKDPFQRAETYVRHMTYFGKFAPADYLIVKDAGHSALLGSARPAWEERQRRFLSQIGF